MTKERINLEFVQSAIDALSDGKVTSYAEIGELFRDKNLRLAVANILKRKEVSPEDAARVIPTERCSDGFYFIEDEKFISHHGINSRSEALKRTSIEFESVEPEEFEKFKALKKSDKGKKFIRIKKESWMSAEELQPIVGNNKLSQDPRNQG